ncbi:hypothetical protein DY000_02041853 [Brassica cretica]|uniref:Uncharacterized protein n=1 Tax=Brassica cretica TaxID=69181 RepID=A0ABQ7BJB7_BRACR|nr:hypothetical protein DY000_02041853 [Brassica cretica]
MRNDSFPVKSLEHKDRGAALKRDLADETKATPMPFSILRVFLVHSSLSAPQSDVKLEALSIPYQHKHRIKDISAPSPISARK